MEQYQFHIYYGYGKGKTTASIGLAIRALGAGYKVCLIQFDKGFNDHEEHYSERILLRTLSNMDVFSFGMERVLSPTAFRFKNIEEDFREAQKALQKSMELLISGTQQLLILDEILAAVMCQLISRDEVMKLVQAFQETRRCELVMTGHQIWPELLQQADLVTEINKKKHYFDNQVKARRGFDF
jgi:cob(I)alamin adenosyltransferase